MANASSKIDHELVVGEFGILQIFRPQTHMLATGLRILRPNSSFS